MFTHADRASMAENRGKRRGAAGGGFVGGDVADNIVISTESLGKKVKGKAKAREGGTGGGGGGGSAGGCRRGGGGRSSRSSDSGVSSARASTRSAEVKLSE